VRVLPVLFTMKTSVADYEQITNEITELAIAESVSVRVFLWDLRIVIL